MMKVSVQRRDHQDEDTDCNVDLSIPLEIAYGLDINPKIEIGKVKTYPGRRRVCRRRDGKYVMHQLICVEIPFDIDVEIECPNHFPNNIE